MHNFVDSSVLEFLNEPGKAGCTLGVIVAELRHFTPGVLISSIKALVESGYISAEGSSPQYYAVVKTSETLAPIR